MWSTEYTATTPLSRREVWRAIELLHRGELSYPGADVFELIGPFAVGSRIDVTPVGQPTFRSTIVELEEAAVYADRTEFDGLTLLFRHTLAERGGATVVTHRLEIDGVGADEAGPELGPQISADFPDAMAALLAAADANRRV
ncbi:polyketide cyclase [Microbacteriaceae bacterium VKM Ac-2854]|nr:polyketide cyclase [Microbacteriaceae bacterium VKM Ac-2854]